MTDLPTVSSKTDGTIARPPDDAYVAWERVERCPVCDSPERDLADGPASVVRCRACGHRFVERRPTQEEIARGYSAQDTYQDWIRAAASRQAMWQRRYELVMAARPPGRVLDVGAGIGTFLAIAREHGWSVDGTEVSTTAVARARELHQITLRLGTLERASPSGPYDVICLWHVLEHVPDPLGTLQHCHTLLAADGTIILAMPNDGQAAWSITAVGNGARRLLRRPGSARYERLRPGVESHIHHFNPGSVRSVLTRAGFSVERIGVDDAAPGRTRVGRLAFDARRVLTRLTPWNFGREMLIVACRRPAGD